jgi:uncharacterized protein
MLPLIAVAYVSPGKPTGFVNDFANIIDREIEQAIESKLVSLNNTTSAQISVVTIPSLGGDTRQNYAVKLFEDWGLGQKGKDNGLLLLIALDEREMQIEVGYGLEGDITDLQSGIIVRDILTPAFREGDYSGGIVKAVDMLSGIIYKSPDALAYIEDHKSNTNSGGSNSEDNLFGLFFFGVILLNLFARILGKTKSWWLGGAIGAVIGTIIGLIWGFISIGLISIIILTILGLIFDYIVSKNPPGSGGHGGGLWFLGSGGGRGGFGGGGFGGFGGGMSGGGGAGGRW